GGGIHGGEWTSERREPAPQPAGPVHGPVGHAHGLAGGRGAACARAARVAGRDLRPGVLQVPVCTPSRASMWTGVHAKQAGLWDNTNFAWIGELSPGIPTIGHMLREQGYYTAFKGKWHVSAVPRGEDALERYGFSDYQQWGEMFGAPLQGAMLD